MLVVAGCAPTLDWREVRPEGTSIVALLPCRPSRFARPVELAERRVVLALWACSAGGRTWGIAHADLADPRLSGAALRQLLDAAGANVGAARVDREPWNPAGATPHAEARRARFSGQMPDGTPRQVEVGVFVVGTRVVQATVVGASPADEAARLFFAGVHAR